MVATIEYSLDDQIGFKLRLANQKYLEIFARVIPEITSTQFAVLAKLNEVGALSQNHLGRLVGMDAATTKGVVDRLVKKKLLTVTPSLTDRRRHMIGLSDEGECLILQLFPKAEAVSREAMENLSKREANRLCELLDKL